MSENALDTKRKANIQMENGLQATASRKQGQLQRVGSGVQGKPLRHHISRRHRRLRLRVSVRLGPTMAAHF